MSLLETLLIDGHDYTFKQLRQMLATLVPQEGVYGAGDYRVTAGAGMSVNVAAGDAWVRMDAGTFNGLYYQKNDASINGVAVTPAHATLPRIDQVVLTVADSTVSGATDTPTVSVLAGTATSGATLDNRSGVAALPQNSIRLADVLVPAASASITSTNIRDRRPWCRGAFVRSMASSTDVTIASATFADIDSINISNRLEIVSGIVVATLTATIAANTATPSIAQFRMGGTTAYFPGRGEYSVQNQPRLIHFEFSWPTIPAGSNVFTPQWASSTAAQLVMYRNNLAGQGPIVFTVRELPLQNTDNG